LSSSFKAPHEKQGRSTSFGNGERINSDRKHRTKAPDSGTYNIKSQFNEKGSKKSGYCFGINRSFYDKVFNEANQPQQGWTEPGLYNLDTFVDNLSKKRMKFGGRLSTTEEDHHKINFPGPGTYD